MATGSRLEKLLEIASDALAPAPNPQGQNLYLEPEIGSLLQNRNGFYAFESALHVFPLTSEGDEADLEILPPILELPSTETSQEARGTRQPAEAFGASSFAGTRSATPSVDPSGTPRASHKTTLAAWLRRLVTNWGTWLGGVPY